MSFVANIFEDLRYQWVKLVGLIFTAQDVDPFTGSGKPRFWVNSGDKKAHFTDTDGNDDALATQRYVDATGAKLGHLAMATTPNAAGADGTFVELASGARFRSGDRVDSAIDLASGADLASMFYPRIFIDNLDRLALKQNQALGGPAQGQTLLVLGRQA